MMVGLLFNSLHINKERIISLFLYILIKKLEYVSI
jgi:hypothetical protein